MNVLARRAGLLIPLFSFPSSSSWGIGDIGDVAPMAAWLESGGQRVLQLLPLNEMPAASESPYSALSAMAIDPVYIRMQEVPEFVADGGESSLSTAERASLEEARRSARVEYAVARRIKLASLTRAFDRFHEDEWRRGTPRATGLAAFVREQGWWLEDYSLYRALHAREGDRSWQEWPDPLRRRERAALERARTELSRDMLRFQYLQWLADMQWREARRQAGARGVALFGDLPFMVDLDSADVWARQDQFRLEVSVGAPPDAFSSEGQDWGMPACHWDVMAADNFGWMRARARRSADLFDGYRVDHLVGLYRTYGRPRGGGAPFFTPAEIPAQVRLGEKILSVLAEPGAEIVAEDLGIIPDYVRASLWRVGVPGLRVLRWEREWHAPGRPFRDPQSYPAVSLATSGTHDTEPMATWWARASDEERQLVSDMPIVRRLTSDAGLLDTPYNPKVRDTLLEALFASGSAIVLNVIQDVFGSSERINVPATIDDRNWTFRLPWPVDRLDEIPAARERQRQLREWSGRYGR